jgi:hypothetical protein
VIKEVFSDQPGRPKPVLIPEAPQPVAITETNRNGKIAVKDGHSRGTPVALSQRVIQDDDAKSASFVPDPSQAAANFLEAGLTFLESLSVPCRADVARATGGFEPIKRGLATLLRRDTQTQRPTLAIPLPESITPERLARVISGFLDNLARPS